ncbi:alternative ribosome rescue aminoacyl-tRNA hydrolase ArfB [Agaribacter flavus]|uniref:Alternative ribosome rescue aminoacyl-tRNA hydrolase ArfB n=1 Tax=Agaribacter flavus TaxID=1902781 RepID=A0ABV7FNA8_9ALTE
MIEIGHNIHISEDEIQLSAIRAMGSGGQNVNKVSSAIHLRFNIQNSSLDEKYKNRLLALQDKRISKEGDIVIKAQSYRTQEKNRIDAIERLKQVILSVTKELKARKATRPSLSAKRKRLDSKKRDGKTKALRRKVDY